MSGMYPAHIEDLIRHELHRRGLPTEHYEARLDHMTGDLHVRPLRSAVPSPLQKLVAKYAELLADEFRGKVIQQSHPFAHEKMKEIIEAVEASYQPKEFIISAKFLKSYARSDPRIAPAPKPYEWPGGPYPEKFFL